MWQQRTEVALIPRNLNQDPLDFFSMIRAYGYRKVNSTCYSFTNSFKALVANNFCSSHSPLSNCEDFGEALLSSLSVFIRNDESGHNIDITVPSAA